MDVGTIVAPNLPYERVAKPAAAQVPKSSFRPQPLQLLYLWQAVAFCLPLPGGAARAENCE